MWILLIISCAIAFLVSVLVAFPIIRLLHRLRFGQSILEIGPNWHQKKSGTPTMGGVIFLLGMLVSGIAVGWDTTAWTVFLAALAFGLIGMWDDGIKIFQHHNKGLTARGKLVLQLLVSVIFLAVRYGLGDSFAVQIPFLGTWTMGWVYLPFCIFLLLAGVNSVNLTDGIDGLASGVTLPVLAFFSFAAWRAGEMSLCLLCGAGVGALFAFFLFNKNPARVFMGDTGSLFLGGLITAAAIVLDQPFVLLVVGFVYWMESLSVIIQVVSFQTTGKRVFKMSPLHHHFELCGWSENKIVAVFTAVTIVLCILAFWGI